MGKTPKSKNVNYRSKSHLQPKGAQHRPKNNGAEKLSFPGKSDQCAPAKRRMNVSSSLARKASQHKSFSIKVTAPSSSSGNKELEQTQNMSVVTAEVAETINSDPQSVIILENGKEDSQEKEEENDTKDIPPISNGSEPESVKPMKSDISDNGDTSRKLIQDGNSVQESAIDGEGYSASKLSKDDDGDRKKQRSGTPQSRSSTPQRKSERVRSKQGSPSKTSPNANASPALKILKINLTPYKSSTNGTISVEKTSKVANEDSVKPKDSKNKTVETQEKLEVSEKHGKFSVDVHDVKEDDNECIAMDPEIPKHTDPNAPYLRSLRLISGRRSLTSRSSPCNSLLISSTYEMSSATTSQWKKRQTRKKDGIFLKDDSESDYQDTENEFNTSTISGKRKAERVDDQSSMLAESSLKKPKSEDDELRLFITDEDEEKIFLEKDSSDTEYIDDHLKSSASKQSNSTDYGDDDMAEFKDLPEKDESFIDESMEFAYEASEVEGYVKMQDSSVASNQSSNKRWCILM